MVLLKLSSKKSSDEFVPEQLPALPSNESKLNITNDIPDHLPSINEKSEKVSISQQEINQHNEIEAKKMLQRENEQKKQEVHQTQVKTQKDGVQVSILDDSFISRLQSLIDKDENKKSKFESLLQKDLFAALEEFHESVNSGKIFILHKDELNAVIHDKLENLKVVEHDWHIKKDQLSELKKKVDSDEDKLKQELKELKDLMSKYVENDVDDDKKFYLKNNDSVASITQLKEKLHSMSFEVFNHHVNDYRNDFAEWIDHVFNYKALANKIRSVKSKEELIKLLNE